MSGRLNSVNKTSERTENQSSSEVLQSSLPKAKLNLHGKVAVIGAGAAGLKCALVLKEVGIDIEIFEAAAAPGGRIQSATDSRGITYEKGGHLINDDHTCIKRTAEQYNLSLRHYYPEELGTCLLGYFSGSEYRNRIELAQAIEPLVNQLNKDLTAIAQCKDETVANQIKSESLVDYLTRSRIPTWAKDILLAHVSAEIGESRDKLRVGTFMLFNYEKMTSANPRWEFPGYGRSTIEGGMSRLINAMAGELREQLKFNHYLTAIEKNDNKYHLTFQLGNETIKREFEYLAICIPFSVLKNIDYSKAGFSPARITAINSMSYGNEEKIQFESKQTAHPQDPDAQVVLIDRFAGDLPAYTWNNERSEGHTGDTVRTVFVSDMGALKAKYKSTEAVIEATRESLAKALPNVETGNAYVTDWSNNPLSLGSYSLPPAFSEGNSGLSSKENSQVFFGGEHIGLGKNRKHAAFMNGAMESGDYMAAQIIGNMVLRDRKSF